MKVGPALAALLLLLPVVSAAWDQERGGPSRDGVANMPRGPLDVLAISQLLRDDEWFPSLFFSEPLLAQTPGGLVTIADGPGGACSILRIRDLATADATREPLPGCMNGRLLGYDSVRDALVFCQDASMDAPVLREVVLSTSKDAWPGITPRSTLLSRDQATSPTDLWTCSAAALDTARDDLVVTLTATGNSQGTTGSNADRLVDIAPQDGHVKWALAAPVTQFFGSPAGFAPQFLPATSAFEPTGIALTATGIVEMGVFGTTCAQCLVQNGRSQAEAAALWYTRGGTPAGGLLAVDRPREDATSPSVASRPDTGSMRGPAVRGAIAAFQLGADVFELDAGQTAPPPQSISHRVESADGGLWAASPAWTAHALVVPLRQSFYGVGEGSTTWQYSEGRNVTVEHILPTGDDRLVALLSPTSSTGGDTSALLVLDIVHGTKLQRVPFPMATLSAPLRSAGASLTGFSPLSPDVIEPLPNGEIVAINAKGTAVLFGVRLAPPALSISNEDPATGDVVSFAANSVGDLALDVAWGDGATDQFPPGATANHTYGADGSYDIYATRVLPDNTTMTSVATVHVGGTPLTKLQRAFSPENQNVTFFAIGIVLTLLGALFTFISRRRRVSRLDRELRILDAIAAHARERPVDAAREAERYRVRIRRDLARGDLDDAHFDPLDTRARQLLRALRLRLLAPLETALTPIARRRIEAALEDGTVTRAEVEGILSQLAREQLPLSEREGLAHMLSSWAESDSGADSSLQ